jgi:hypothetical protein
MLPAMFLSLESNYRFVTGACMILQHVVHQGPRLPEDMLARSQSNHYCPMKRAILSLSLTETGDEKSHSRNKCRHTSRLLAVRYIPCSAHRVPAPATHDFSHTWSIQPPSAPTNSQPTKSVHPSKTCTKGTAEHRCRSKSDAPTFHQNHGNRHHRSQGMKFRLALTSMISGINIVPYAAQNFISNVE